jgi:hypothetical protein
MSDRPIQGAAVKRTLEVHPAEDQLRAAVWAIDVAIAMIDGSRERLAILDKQKPSIEVLMNTRRRMNGPLVHSPGLARPTTRR